ncbi:hypothetical protein H9P43_004860 [Blastocladiella emersonii ATCC 22665]|nr:hypothetical protein H9P43_004860 [Blastocladiella emersonii ATCC 22665]
MDGVNELNKAFASPQCRLATFEISYCTYDLVRLLAIRFPSSLSEIKLNGYWFQKSLPRHAFDEWRWPRWLRCKIGDAGLTLIARMLPPYLTSLDISSTEMTGSGFEAMSPFLPRGLHCLDIGDNQLGDAATDFELDWQLPARLTELNVDFSIKTPRAFRALIRALDGNCANLQSLFVSYCHCEASQHMLASILPRGLTKLYLGRSMIDPAELDHYLARCTSLESLSLYRNPGLGHAGMRALAQRMPPRLVELDLGRMDLTDEMLVDVIPALPATLRDLVLSENDITDATAFLLAKHLPRNLANLVIVDTLILGAGYDALYRAGSHKSRCAELLIHDFDEDLESDDHVDGSDDNDVLYSLAQFSRVMREYDILAVHRAIFLRLTGSGFEAISPVLPPGLQVLHIDNNELGDVTTKVELYWRLPAGLIDLRVACSLESQRAVHAVIRALQGDCAHLRSLSVAYYNRDSSHHQLASLLPRGLTALRMFKAWVSPAELDDYLMRLPCLESLDLSKNASLGHAGMLILAKRMPPQLKELYLERVDLDDEMLVDVIPALPATLRELCLRNNVVTDETTVLLFKNLPRDLVKLDLGQTWISEVGADMLCRAAAYTPLKDGHVLDDFEEDEVGEE